MNLLAAGQLWHTWRGLIMLGTSGADVLHCCSNAVLNLPWHKGTVCLDSIGGVIECYGQKAPDCGTC